MPGTFGSIAGLVLYYLVKDSSMIYCSVTLILILIGFLTSGRTEGILQKKDPSCIVIDEVSGMFLSLIFLPYNFKLLIIAFLVFRILDTVKPYPAYKLQNLKGSLGIMSDDLIAGLYTNIILQVVLRLITLTAS